MICERKCIYLLENIKRTQFLQMGVRIFGNSFRYRAKSSQGGDPSGYPGRWFTPREAEVMSRSELQKWCKRLGIRANTKTIQMREDLIDFHQNVLSNSDILRYPFLPLQNSHDNNFMTSHTRQEPQDKLLFKHNIAEPGLGQVRYFKNTPCTVGKGLYEDAVFYSEGLDSSNILPGCKVPSVSKILRTTAPKKDIFVISHWTKKQKELLGEDVFRHKMKEINKKGMEFHAFVHRCFMDRKLNTKVPERLKGYAASISKVFEKIGDVIASETSFNHKNLGYHGKIDTLACYHGNPCIIEWKTSQRQRSSLADCHNYLVQMIAYAGAINSDPIHEVQVQHGLLVIAYEDGSYADVHFLDLNLCRSYWQDWLLRLYQFRNQ